MNNNSAREIKNNFKESTYKLDPNNENRLLKTNDHDAAETLIHIEDLVRTIIKNKQDPLFLVAQHDHGVRQVTTTKLASLVLLTLSTYSSLITDHFPLHTFNPYSDVFVRNVGNGELIEKIHLHKALNIRDGWYQDEWEYGIFMSMAADLSEFVNAIRRETQGHQFKNSVYNARRSSKKNHKSLLTYIDWLFARYARLLVLRIDFGYQQGHAIRSESERLVKYLEAQNDRVHFFNNTKSNGLFKHMVGYVWKLEYGAEKGFHYHMLFFFDGSKVRKDQTLAMLIGKYWQQVITPGRGLYFNCNANKNLYKSLGIGMINHDDTALRSGLNQAAAYLIKTDYYARMLTPDKADTFGKGEMFELEEDKPGRPRQYECSRSVLTPAEFQLERYMPDQLTRA